MYDQLRVNVVVVQFGLRPVVVGVVHTVVLHVRHDHLERRARTLVRQIRSTSSSEGVDRPRGRIRTGVLVSAERDRLHDREVLVGHRLIRTLPNWVHAR